MHRGHDKHEGPAQAPLKLAPAMSFSLAGQVAFLLSQLAVLASLTWLRGAEAVGEFGLAIALTTPFFTFVSMGGKSSQSSDVAQRFAFAEYGGLVTCLAIFGLIGSLVAGMVFARTDRALLIVIIVAFMKVAGSISNLAYGAFQQAGRPDKIAISLILRGALTVPIFIYMLVAGAPVGLAFMTQLAVWTAVAFLWDYPTASRIAAGAVVRPLFNWSRLFALGRETAPYGASMSLEALTNSLPRITVERALGLPAVGILTVVTYFQQAGSILTSSITQPLVNRFARLRQAGDHRALMRTQFALIALVAGCSVAGVTFVVVAGEWLLKTLFGPELASASDLLILIALALSAKLFSAIPQSLLHADRRYSAFFWRELATVLLCLVLLALLVPNFGLMGAGYAILGCAIFRMIIISLAVAMAPGGRGITVGASLAHRDHSAMTVQMKTERSGQPDAVVRDVVILNDFGFVNGGQSKIAIDSALALQARGIAVCFIAGRGPLDERLLDHGVECHVVGDHDILHDPNRLRAATSGIWNREAAKVTERCIATRDPATTVVHIHGWAKALSPSIGPVVTRAKAPHIYTLHEYFLACPNGGFYDYRANAICRRRPLGADCLTTRCDPRGSHHKAWRVARQAVLWSAGNMPRGLRELIYLAPEQRDILGPYMPPPARWHYLPNPVRSRPHQRIPAEGNAAFLFVGRLSPEKGGLLAARAAAAANVPIVFAGDGEEREAILNANPSARMLGWISPERVAEEMRRARALLFPSLWYETYGLVVADALRAGLPILVSDSSVAASLVDPSAGEHIPAGDVESWSEAISRMASDERVRLYSENAYRLGDQLLDDDRWARRLMDIYEAVLVRRKGMMSASAEAAA